MSLEILKTHGRQALHESSLEFLGSQSMVRDDVVSHLEDLSITFDYVVEIAQSPSLGDYANKAARPVVIDGSWEMVNDGFHREAMSWITSMRAIFQETILRDAPDEEQKQYVEQYQILLAKLGFYSEGDFQRRAEDGKQLLDEVMQVAEQIVETNERIVK